MTMTHDDKTYDDDQVSRGDGATTATPTTTRRPSSRFARSRDAKDRRLDARGDTVDGDAAEAITRTEDPC